MQFSIHKNYANTWNLVPLEGPLAGEIIACADGVNLAGVRFNGSEMAGIIKSCWGLVLAYDQFDFDLNTLRGLGIGRRFDLSPNTKVRLDSDGVKDCFTLRLLKGAKRVMAIGDAVYTKGLY